ncbi:MAG: ECF-type sigma factor [Phycisphaerales bacterium]
MTDPTPPSQTGPQSPSEPPETGTDPEDLLPLVYDELRRIAGGYMRQERSEHTLQATALVHEAFIRLADRTGSSWADATHFRAMSAKVMRQVLVDSARKAGAVKRGGGRVRLTLTPDRAALTQRPLDVVALAEALDDLAALHERKARVVELIVFGGMTHAEVAGVTGVSRKTVEADWYMARAWLGKRLDERGPDEREPGEAGDADADADASDRSDRSDPSGTAG